MTGHAERSPEQAAERDAFWIGVLASVLLGTVASSDVGYGDAGELSTAAVGLGVAHPTGFAIDLLWLKAASLVPLGDLALRLNLATAVTGGVAIGLCAALTGLLALRVGVRDPIARRIGVLAAVSAVSGFGVFLIAARAVEVYALALCAVLFAFYAVVRGGRDAPLAGALVPLIGISPGLHVTAGLYALVIAIGYAFSRAYPLRWLLVRLPALLAGALVIAYLPLASARDPFVDWGDPETLPRIFAHLTAARIRSAYRADMFGAGQSAAPYELAQQLAVFAALFGAILLAIAVTLRARARHPETPPVSSNRTRITLLGLALVGLLDLAYALFVNPMGVRDLQVGHVAGAALGILGGVSVARLLGSLPAMPRREVALRWVRGAALLACVSQASLGFDVPAGDGYVLGELFGSGGLVPRLPPRTVFVCASDDACASAMFGLFVERVRPDMDVAPAQHLWDATVTRHIETLRDNALRGAASAERATQVLRRLLAADAPRPIALEASEIVRGVTGVALRPIAGSALLTPGALAGPEPMLASLRAIDSANRARFFGRVPTVERDRILWSRVYGELGAIAIGTPAAMLGVQALERATMLAPERATAWNNLGVALLEIGDLPRAAEVTRRALTTDPTRASAWVNLARISLQMGDAQAAKRVLHAAREARIEDPRLKALSRQLAAAPASAQAPATAP